MEYDKMDGWHVGRNGYDRYVLPRARSSTLQAVFFAASSEIPYFLRKENLDPLPGTLLIAVYAAGHHLRVTSEWHIVYFYEEGLDNTFLSFPCKESLMPAASSRSPHLTKATKAFVDAITAENNPPLYTLRPRPPEGFWRTRAKPIKKLAMDMHDEDLPVGPTGKVPTRFIRPEGGWKAADRFYFHGGGWILGDKDTHDRLVRELAKGAKAAVVYPNYTPSPEAQYPVPLEQAYAAMLYIIEHADAYGLDPSRSPWRGTAWAATWPR